MDGFFCGIFFILVLQVFPCKVSSSPNIECNPSFKKLGSLGSKSYYYGGESTKSWPVANRTCREYKDTYLVTVPEPEILIFLLSKLGPKPVFWLGIEEIEFAEWKWLNDGDYIGNISTYSGPMKTTCGLINPQVRYDLGKATCFLEKRFICTGKKSNSHLIGDYYMSGADELLTWYQAREMCLCMGMDLAMPTAGSLDYLYTLLDRNTELFWIGLQKTRFVWESTGGEATYLPFKKNQPDDHGTIEDCLQYHGDDKSSGFNDIPCQNKYKFICQWENKTVPSDYSRVERLNQRGDDSTEGGGTTVSVAVVVVLCLVVVAVVTLGLLAIYKFRTGWKGTTNWQRFGRDGDNRNDEDLSVST